MGVQPYLFQVPDSITRISVYQDRSGSYGDSRWLVWGLLFIPSENEQLVYEQLQKAKEEENCRSPLHFADLPGSWGGAGKHKPRTAFQWIDLTRILLLSDIQFIGFALDTHYPDFKHDAFDKEFHLNNRFIRMALTSAIPWFYKGMSKLELSMYFHRQTFMGSSNIEGGFPGQDYDNISDYLISESTKDLNSRHQEESSKSPEIHINEPIEFISTDPDEENTEDQIGCEFIQLTDILAGAINQAIDGKSKNKVKQELSSIVGEWMADIRLQPWKQKFGMHRRFIVSYFPGNTGKPYQDGPLRLSSRIPGTRQKELF